MNESNGGGPVGGGSQIVVHQCPYARRRFSVGGMLMRVVGFVLPIVLIAAIFGAMAGGLPAENDLIEKHHSLNRDAASKIALVRIEGTILQGEGYFRDQLDRIREDENVKAIVLRVDSPGGTITASDYMLHHLKKLRDDRELPIVVSMGSLAASGGYYVSMCVGDEENSIYAEPTTWTGSIGVIIPHYDLSGLMQSWQIADDSVASGEFKSMGSITKPMTEEERALFQTLVDDSFGRFKRIIREGRPEFRDDAGSAKLDELADGRIYTADQALEAGLVDQIGFLEDAIARAAALADLDVESTNCVEYSEPMTLRHLLASAAFGGNRAKSGVAGLLNQAAAELSAPRAYFLFTHHPVLYSTQR